MPKKHRVLLRFSKNNVLDDTSSGTEDEGRRNIVKLLNDKYDANVKERMNKKVRMVLKKMRDGPMDITDRRVNNLTNY